MSAAHSIPILAVVTDDERPIVEAAARLLAEALSQTGTTPWSCACTFATNLEEIAEATNGSVVVTSLLVQLAQLDTSWENVERELRSYYAALGQGGDPIMICTILRHVATENVAESANRIRRRLRQLNLLATELSREYGAFVIDLDRILADVGARRLETDYRLRGPIAVDVASKAVAIGIVANALDNFASVEAQDAARVVLDNYRPAVALPTEFKPLNMIALGQGRRKQFVSTVIDTVQENYVGWLIRQVLKRQLGLGEAFQKLVQAVRRRGARESAALLLSGIKQLFRAPI